MKFADSAIETFIVSFGAKELSCYLELALLVFVRSCRLRSNVS